MIKKLKKYPFYLLLLPVFFVLHGYLENFGFLSWQDAGILALSYLGMSVGICLFSWLIFRNITKAAIITTVWMAFFFFFAAIHEFFKGQSWLHWLSRYSILLPVSFAGLIVLFILLFKSRPWYFRFNLYVNILMIIYIVVDTAGIAWKATHPSYRKLSVYRFARQESITRCDTCARPDIFFLLFDEYGSSYSLEKRFGFHNDLDSFLMQKGFSLQRKSRSNYNFTAFSMSATLNMSFIEGIGNVNAVNAEDYANCNILIRDNQLIHFLDAQGYEINNYSMFDLAGNPSRVEQSFLPLKTKLITDRTLFARMNRDIGWLINTKFPFNLFQKNFFFRHKDNNRLFTDLVKKNAAEKKNQPRFVYAHFYMPHPPFFYDKNGRERNNDTVYNEYHTHNIPAYLEYVQYTNNEIRKLVNNIQRDDPGAVIIILGDHGYRYPSEEIFPNDYFRNMNAVYFPDRDYRLLYDSVTNINMFRIVLNKYFAQSYPLMKDSCVLLTDKK